MQLKYNIMIIGLIMLSACSQSAVEPEETETQNVSNIPELLEEIQEVTPDIAWEEAKPSVYSEAIWLNEDETIPPNTLSGLRMSGSGSNLTNYENDLERMLREEGWFTWHDVARADGPYGGWWGYPMYTEEGQLIKVIIFSWQAGDSIRSEVFLSDEIGN